MSKPKVTFRELGDAFLGEIELPMVGGGKVVASSVGWNPFDTLARAATVAERIALDPALAPIIPPQALLAAKTARAVANTGRRNIELLRGLTPNMSPASKQLSKALQRAARKKRKSGTYRGRGRARGREAEQPLDYDPALDPYAAQYADPYATQDPYANPTPPTTPSGFTPTPEDQAALEAWGADAFAKGSWGESTAEPQGEWAEQYAEPGYVGDDQGGGEEPSEPSEG